MFSEKPLKKILLGAYIFISAAFILWSGWQYLIQNVYSRGIADGQAAAVNQLLTAAEKCEPIPVFAGEKKVELISTTCGK